MTKLGMVRVLGALMLGAMFLGLGVPQSRAGAAPDWVVAKASLPADGISQLSMTLGATIHPAEEGPVIVVTGESIGGFRFFSVGEVENGGLALRASIPAGGATLRVTAAGTDTFRIETSSGIGGRLRGTAAAVIFVANGTLSDVTASFGGLPTQVTQGSGTKPIHVAGEEETGVAADVALAALGSTSHDETVARGLLGAWVPDCVRCDLGWTSPDGSTGTMSAQRSPLPVPAPLPVPLYSIEGDLIFGGPAGPWSWSWTGLNAHTSPSTTVVGAYAPIGDDWQLFQGGSGFAVPAQPIGKPSPAPGGGGGTKVLATKKSLAGTGVGKGAAGLVLVGLAAIVAWTLVRTRPIVGASGFEPPTSAV